MKWLIAIFLSIPSVNWAQLNFQLGQQVIVGNRSGTYVYDNGGAKFEYASNFQKLGTATFLKVGSYQLLSEKRFSLKYTLEFGLKYYNYRYSTQYLEPEYSDENLDYTKDFVWVNTRSVSWMNGMDFIYRINPKQLFVGTLGFKLEAQNTKKKQSTFPWVPLSEGSQFPIVNPVMSVNLGLQYLFHFNKVSVGVHLNQDLFVINQLINKARSGESDIGKFYHSPFTGLGISIMPNFYLMEKKEPIDFED